MRWRCRRGMLELDILLAHFVERHYACLDETQRSTFNTLLDMPDAELWDMITEKMMPSRMSGEFSSLLELIRMA